jgi:hypothetical protein
MEINRYGTIGLGHGPQHQSPWYVESSPLSTLYQLYKYSKDILDLITIVPSLKTYDSVDRVTNFFVSKRLSISQCGNYLNWPILKSIVYCWRKVNIILAIQLCFSIILLALRVVQKQWLRLFKHLSLDLDRSIDLYHSHVVRFLLLYI